MADSSDSTILQEEIDEGYEPTEEEIMEFASWLGLDLPQDNTLLWIAREGLKAPLPGQWKPCRTEEDEIYYFNFDTGESSWNHPCDEFYRTLYKEEAQKRQLQQQQRQPTPLEQRKDTANLPQKYPNEMRSADQLILSRSLEPVANDFSGMTAPKPSQVVSPKYRISTSGEWGESEIRLPSTSGVPNPKTDLSQEELKGTGQECDINSQPAPNGQKLVIKWKAAMQGVTPIASQTQEKPSVELHVSGNKEEERKLQHGNVGGSPVTHPLREETVETEQRRDQMMEPVKLKLGDEEEGEEILKRANEVVQKEQRDMYKSMQAEMLEQIKRELEEGDSLVEQRRKEIIEEVERQIEAEKKRLQEIQKKKLEKDLEHEQEMLQQQEEERKHVWAAKLKQDEEEEARMNADLEARRRKRDEDLAVLLEAETKNFEAQSLERLEFFRRNLEEEETKLMQSVSEQMLSRVCDRQQSHESAVVEEMRQEMLARMKQMVIALEKGVFERELETARQRVREKAQLERKSLLVRLEREVEAEVASLKEEMLKEKREQMLQQVHEKIAEEQRLELEKIQRSSPGKEKRVAENTRRSTASSEATRVQTPEELPLRAENEERFMARGEANGRMDVNCDLVNVLQKAACEVLLSLVVRNRADNEKKGCCSCCDDRYVELKHSMSHFEEEVKVMISSIRDETKEALASLKIEEEGSRRQIVRSNRDSECFEHCKSSRDVKFKPCNSEC